MDRWIGKVAIITGASSGIGAGIAKKLVEEGMTVVGLARRIDKMEELARTLSGKRGYLYPVKCDITVESDILDAFQYVKNNLGPIHVLVNNAGVAKNTTLMDGDTESWKQILDVNVMGLAITTREAIKDMIENQIDGQIININSVFGHRVSQNVPLNIYPASKFAVTAFTESLRYEFCNAKSRIKVTSLSPGFVVTEIFEASGISAESLAELFEGNLPALNPEDIAAAVIYILSTPPNVMVTELGIQPVHQVA
nr:farnesol dehydrogenase-like [Leptinotarsa decemlineata]